MAEEIAGIARAAEARFEAERRGENVDRSELDGPSAVALGAQLFTNLFSGRIRSFFDESLGRLQPSSEGLRIKLQLDLEHPEVAALHGLPWEFLNDAEQAHPLGLDLRFSIVRHVPQRRSIVAVPLPRPLRILCASAEPRGQPLLALEDELRRIVEALHQPGEIEVRPLPGATLESIRRELTGPDEFHVLHFMGHGEFDPESGDGVLYLENGRRGAAIVRGGLLADHLRDRTSLRLVFLNACRTARVAAPNPFGGVATSLVRAGVPAVIAMQFPITDGAAVAFSETVYRRIAAGDPIDAAVTEGRIAIRTRAPKALEWGTPVLFSHAPEGRLFEAARSDPSGAVPSPVSPTGRKGWWPKIAGTALALALALGIAAWKIPRWQQGQPQSEEKADRPTGESTARPTDATSESATGGVPTLKDPARLSKGGGPGTQREAGLDRKVGVTPLAGPGEKSLAVKTEDEKFDKPSSQTPHEAGTADPWDCPSQTDSFENTASFPLRQEPRGEFGLTGGEFKMGNVAGSSTQRRCKFCPISAHRFRASSKIRVTSRNGSGGIYFLDDLRSNRGYTVEADATGNVFVKHYVGDFGGILWQGTIAPNQVSQIEAEVTSKSIVAIANGRRLAEVAIKPGSFPDVFEIGMILDGAPAEVYFDDLTLAVCE
jgi:hypothetical protein